MSQRYTVSAAISSHVTDTFVLPSGHSNGFDVTNPWERGGPAVVPTSSPLMLLCTAKGHYLHRLSAKIDPSGPGFEEAMDRVGGKKH